MRATLLALLLVLAGCDMLGPSTTFEADNRTGRDLEVLAAKCGALPVRLLFVVPAGDQRSQTVEPGCYVVEGWVVGEWKAVQVTIQVDEGTRRVVEFELMTDRTE
jgi:hypothetical protein